jgi:NADPH:quinone reductase
VEGNLMLGLVTTPNGKAPMELREVPEPQPQRNEALVAVHAFSLNRGELRSIRNNGEGWIPGQDGGWRCAATGGGRQRPTGRLASHRVDR